MSATLDHAMLPIAKYLDPKKFTELKANCFGEIFLEAKDRSWHSVSIPDLTHDRWWKIGRALSKVTGQRFNEKMPSIRGILPGGHRLFMVIGSTALDRKTGNAGLMVAIRIRSYVDFQFEEFGLDAAGVKIILDGLHNRDVIAIAGGTGSGKTTFARSLCRHLKDKTPVSVEDTPELDLQQTVAQSLLLSPEADETELGTQHILDAITRLRPDRVLIGELTTHNCRLLDRLLNIGVDGTIFTIHADSAEDTVPAIAQLFAQANFGGGSMEDSLNRKIGMVIHCKDGLKGRGVTEIYRPAKNGGKVLWKPS